MWVKRWVVRVMRHRLAGKRVINVERNGIVRGNSQRKE